MHFDELLPIYELFQIIFIDIDSFLALAAMTITRLAIGKKFESIEIVPIIHPSGPFYNYAASNRDQERIFNSALSVISATARRAPDGVKHDCLNALEAQSIASGQEQEDTPVKSRSFRPVRCQSVTQAARLIYDGG